MLVDSLFVTYILQRKYPADICHGKSVFSKYVNVPLFLSLCWLIMTQVLDQKRVLYALRLCASWYVYNLIEIAVE
jgi:hypothetical protein